MIHDNKYAHRDIQPKNILLFNNGSIVKISDFGSITNKYYNDINSNPALRAEVIFDITKNTLQFSRAPEETNVYSGNPINEKSDIWSLGLVLLSMLVSFLPSSPFESFYFGLLRSKCIPLNKITEMKKICNPYLVELMKNLLKINPKERPSANDIIAYLDKYQDQASNNSSNIKEKLLFGKNIFKSITTSIKKNTTSFLIMKLMLPFPNQIPKMKYIKYLVHKGWEKEEKINTFYQYLSLSLVHFFTLSGLKSMFLLHKYIYLGRHEFFTPVHFNLDEFLSLFYNIWSYRAQNFLFDKSEIIRSNKIAKFIAVYSDFIKKKINFLSRHQSILDSNNSLLTNDYNKIISKAFIEDSLCFFNQTYTLLLSIPFNSNCLLGTLDVIAEAINEELISLFNLLYYCIIGFKNTVFNDKQALSFETDFIQIASKGKEYLDKLKKYRTNIRSQVNINDCANGGDNYAKCIEYLQNVKYNSNFNLKSHFGIDMNYFGVKMNKNNMGILDDQTEEMILIGNNSQDEGIVKSKVPSKTQTQTQTHGQSHHFDFNEENFVINKHLDFQLKKRNHHHKKGKETIADLIETNANENENGTSVINNPIDKTDIIKTKSGGKIEINNDDFETAKSRSSNNEEKFPSNIMNFLTDIFESNNSTTKSQNNNINNSHESINDQFNNLFINNNNSKQNNSLVPFADLVKNTNSIIDNNMNSFSHDSNRKYINNSSVVQPNPQSFFMAGQTQLNQMNNNSNNNSIYNKNIYTNPNFNSNQSSGYADSNTNNSVNYLWNNVYIQQQPYQAQQQNLAPSSHFTHCSNSNYNPTSFQMYNNSNNNNNMMSNNNNSMMSNNNNQLALNQLRMNSLNNTVSSEKSNINANATNQSNSREIYESANSQLSNINIINIVENYNIGNVIENNRHPPQIDKLANEFLLGEFCKPNFQFLIASKDISLGRRIGFGGSSEVFIGNYRGTEVAVKKLRILEVKDENLKEFKREVSSLIMLRHPNLVLFMGAIAEENSICIVTEYCAGGTLFNVLHQRLELILTWGLRLRILLEIATGMNFLHTNEPPVIHRDLKSLNILLTDKIEKLTDMTTIKISDFGLSKIIFQLDTTKEAMTGQLGTCHWMAPEVIKSTFYTIKADVYSFAIIIWEMCTRTTPYKDMTQQQISFYVTVKKGRPDKNLIPPNTPVGVRIKLYNHAYS